VRARPAEARIDLLRKEDALKLLTEPGTQLVSLPSPAAQGPVAEGSGVVLFNLGAGPSSSAGASRAAHARLRAVAPPWRKADRSRAAASRPRRERSGDIRPELRRRSTGGLRVSIEQKGGERDTPKGPIILTGALAPP
jgi:hypothetical protein